MPSLETELKDIRSILEELGRKECVPITSNPIALALDSLREGEPTLKRKSYLVGRGIYSFVGYLNELTVKVDKKGRIIIPSKVRKELGIGNIVKIRVEEGEVALKPVEDPLKSLEKLVIKGTTDVENDIRRLHETAERRLLKEA